MNLFSIIKERSTHGTRLERWLGKEEVDRISSSMKNWYGPPIAIAGVPGNVWAHKGGDFRGPIRSGQFINLVEWTKMRTRRVIQSFGYQQRQRLNAGFSSMSDLIQEATTGKSRYFQFNKTGPTGVATVTSSLWRVGTTPPAGTAPGAAPGGTAFDDSSTGAFQFLNPAGGDTQHFVKSDYTANIINQNLLLYDLIFGVAKTMNDTNTEAVTGVPTRYQSITASDMDYAGGNFLFVQVGGTQLAGTAHNWTVCTYTDQGGNASTLPSLIGNSAAIVDRLDHPALQWFAPLEASDTGIRTLTQMQCSALVATGVVWFMIGHPIAFMPGPGVANQMLSLDGIMTAFNLVRIFDDAALAFLQVQVPSASATTYSGIFQTVSG